MSRVVGSKGKRWDALSRRALGAMTRHWREARGSKRKRRSNALFSPLKCHRHVSRRLLLATCVSLSHWLLLRQTPFLWVHMQVRGRLPRLRKAASASDTSLDDVVLICRQKSAAKSGLLATLTTLLLTSTKWARVRGHIRSLVYLAAMQKSRQRQQKMLIAKRVNNW